MNSPSDTGHKYKDSGTRLKFLPISRPTKTVLQSKKRFTPLASGQELEMFHMELAHGANG